jgi:hypothetical protein
LQGFSASFLEIVVHSPRRHLSPWAASACGFEFEFISHDARHNYVRKQLGLERTAMSSFGRKRMPSDGPAMDESRQTMGND